MPTTIPDYVAMLDGYRFTGEAVVPPRSMAEAERVYKEVSRFINSHDVDPFFAWLVTEHPTLQQKFVGGFLRFMYHLADKSYVDGRNEASHEAAKKIKEVLGDYGAWLPYV